MRLQHPHPHPVESVDRRAVLCKPCGAVQRMQCSTMLLRCTSGVSKDVHDDNVCDEDEGHLLSVWAHARGYSDCRTCA
jgi:hypothetical protein